MPNYTKSFWLTSLLLFVLSATAYGIKPSQQLALAEPIRLEAVFPVQFSGWRIDNSIIPLELSPELLAKVSSIYDQTLSRTYINADGYKIMLSVAYGGNQSSDSTQVHRPEFCYASQGFAISSSEDLQLKLNDKQILPLRLLLAQQGTRVEPISYWITIGSDATQPGLGRKWLQMKYGLSGKIPDGMLVRVSSIDENRINAYRIQQEFIHQLFDATDNEVRHRIYGA